MLKVLTMNTLGHSVATSSTYNNWFSHKGYPGLNRRYPTRVADIVRAGDEHNQPVHTQCIT